MKRLFSIVIPVYGNEENLPESIPLIMERLDLFPRYKVEIIMVCDGSPDKSYDVMKKYQSKYPEIIKIAKFNKNYGQRAAINCGMALAKGDVIGVISADLQDPFDLFVQMIKEWENGSMLVFGTRKNREDKGIISGFSKLAHKLIRKLINKNYPKGGFDFFVVDRRIASEFVKSDTKVNSLQLLLLELAGNGKQIEYLRKERTVGKSGWGFKKKFEHVINIATIYSDKPFRVMALLGLIALFLSIVLIISNLVMGSGKDQMVYVPILYYLLMFFSGAIMTSLGIFGIYGFKWMQNMQNTPRYIISEIVDETDNK